MIAVFVPGHCAPQGSIKFMGLSKAGRAILTGDCKRTKDWRADIRAALLNDDGRPKATFDGPVHIEVQFVLPRPKSAPKKREPAATKRPDLDKLLRALLDAITSAGVWHDDAQWTSGYPLKRIAKIGETPGCHLEIMNEKQAEERSAE